ncbi:MAG: tetratricopeptide repeat protein [Verrucomicrobiota bacterium]
MFAPLPAANVAPDNHPVTRRAAYLWFLAKSCSTVAAKFLPIDCLRIVILVTVSIAVRIPALQGEWIWDDNHLVRDNPFAKSPALILETFRHYLFQDSLSVHYRPVQNISYIFDYFFWSTNTWGFHVTNVVLHTVSGLLLYFLLRPLFASLIFPRISADARVRLLQRVRWISHASFLVALIWVLHPIHSAVVDYISGRADSLAFLFACAGWLIFLRARESLHPVVRGSLYTLAAGSGLAALCSREVALVWIAIFVAHLLLVEKRTAIRLRVLTTLCCSVVVLTYFGLRRLPEPRATAPPSENWSAPVRATMMARALGDYGRLIVLPRYLHVERTVFDPLQYGSNAAWRSEVGVEYLSILGVIVLAGLIVGSAKRGRTQALRMFGASWFLAGYLPISNLVSLNATVAEHWLYLPSVGFLIFIAGCSLEIPQLHRRFTVPLALVMAAALGTCSYLRSEDWTTAETFYQRTLSAGGTSARIGVNLAQISSGRRDYAEAERILRNVLKVAPNYPLAQNNLADALSRQGKEKEAEDLFSGVAASATTAVPNSGITWIGALNLAAMRHKAGDDTSAIATLERARHDYPDVWEITAFESEILRGTEGPDAAMGLMQTFATANWWHHGAALAVGRLYAQKGDVDLAVEALRRASLLDVHDTESLRLIVLMRLRQNRFDEALQVQRRSVARQPDEPRQYMLLSDVLEKLGRSSESRAALARAAQLRLILRNQLTAN